MKRHPSLRALSEHHHHALVQALLVRRAGEAPAAERPARLREIAEDFLRFWGRAGQAHFREEEQVLLPAYSRHVQLDSDPAVMRMLADHAAIRALVEDLEKSLASGEPVDRVVKELGERLQSHVRLEEDQIFPQIEATLSEEELHELARRITRLHRNRKG